MARHPAPKGKQLRQHVALEAARIMVNEHITDFAKAKKKAADRLGITTRNDMPTNQEIEKEFLEYRALFAGAATAASLDKQRRAALDAMVFFERFNPRLAGPVLEGSADEHAQVQLHLFAEMPDDVIFFLMEKGIEYDQTQRTVKYKSGKIQSVPCIEFDAGEQSFSLLIFPAIDIRQAPLSAVNGLPMQRADVKKLNNLLDQSSLG